MEHNNSAYQYQGYGEGYNTGTVDSVDPTLSWQQWTGLQPFQNSQHGPVPTPIGHQQQQASKQPIGTQYPHFSQQAQQQQQKHFANKMFDHVPKPPSMQNSSFQQFTQQQQKFFGSKIQHAQKTNTRATMGYPGMTSGDWSMPSQHQQQQKNSFAKKQMFTTTPAWKNKKNDPKKFDPTGKSPAMLLHELFRSVHEEYSEVPGMTKMYKCTLTADGNEFTFEANNKKLAKQKAAEVALKQLRPDIAVTPIEEVIPVKKNPSNPSKRSADEEDFTLDLFEEFSPIKKKKQTALDTSASLLDLMRKLIAEAGVTYNPQFDTQIVEDMPGDEEKKTSRKFIVTLKFAEQDAVFTREGTGRNVPKDQTIRDALKELFKVSEEDIRTVIRRSMTNKLSRDNSPVQMLYQVAALSNCEATFDIQTITDSTNTSEGIIYTATCNLVDHSNGDKTATSRSPPVLGKYPAKELAATEMLKTYFNIDPTVDAKKEVRYGPIALLQVLLSKQGNRNLKYEPKDDITSGPNVSFNCDCVVDDTKRYRGTGRSKQIAKSNSAIQALKEILNLEYNPEFDYSTVVGKRPTEKTVSQLCNDISEFSRREYFGMCKFFGVNPSNNLACFYLVNEKDEKRLISMASSMQYVVDPAAIKGANGTAIIHMDPIVLARRSFIRHLMTEAAEADTEKSIFEKAPNGLLSLKKNMRVVLFSSVPPHCKYSIEEANEKKLSYLTPTTFTPVPDTTQSMEEINEIGLVRVHSTADKIFKWNQVGVQGALLSTIINPIHIDSIFFGSEAPASDKSLKYALFGRFGEPSTMEHQLESQAGNLRIRSGSCHVFTRGSDNIEVIDYNTGRQLTGQASLLCKQELLKAVKGLLDANIDGKSYEEVKKLAVEYQKTKNDFYTTCEVKGLGKWQVKPTALVDFSTEPNL